MSYTSPSPASRLRALLKDPNKIIVAPGVYDGYSARMALHVGFDALYMTGAGASISRTGMADLGLTTMTEMTDNARMIANIDRNVPLIADADTGYGSPINVGRTVQNYINAGVAAFHLEDQVVNKKCGHLEGKQCVSREEYLARIRAAVLMRDQVGSDIVIIARTDALQQFGLEEAIDRLKAAVKVGADVAMLEAITQRHEVEALSNAFKETGVPLMYGMVQNTKSFKMTPAEAKELGFSIIIYAVACSLPYFESVSKALRTLKAGDCEKYDERITPHSIFDICGIKNLLEFDKKCVYVEKE